MTNKSPTGPNRGYGCQQLYFCLEGMVDRLDEQLQEVSTALAVQSAESSQAVEQHEEAVWNGVLALLLGSAVVAIGLCVSVLRDESRNGADTADVRTVVAEPLALPLPLPGNGAAALSDDQVRQFAMALRGYLEDRDRRRPLCLRGHRPPGGRRGQSSSRGRGR